MAVVRQLLHLNKGLTEKLSHVRSLGSADYQLKYPFDSLTSVNSGGRAYTQHFYVGRGEQEIESANGIILVNPTWEGATLRLDLKGSALPAGSKI